MVDHDDSRARLLPEYLRSAIGRAVVDHDDFLGAALRQRGLLDAFQYLAEGRKFVVNRNEDGNLHGFCNTDNSDWPKGGGITLSRRERIGTTPRSKTSIWPSD